MIAQHCVYLMVFIFVFVSFCNATDDVNCNIGVWSTLDANKGNKTALRTIKAPTWVSAPQFRGGTMAILQSCVLTLVACIYTAIHMNVPQKTNFWGILLAKIKWLFIALFVPEVVIYTAADQYIQARKLKKDLELLKRRSSIVDQNFVFDMRYTLFVVMGGLSIDTSYFTDFLSNEVHANQPRSKKLQKMMDFLRSDQSQSIPLTTRGVLDLAERGHWIYQTRAKIDDKSKANKSSGQVTPHPFKRAQNFLDFPTIQLQ
ncbi:hypothetical protein ACMFMG_004277 [Clarireedia jacksonii]